MKVNLSKYNTKAPKDLEKEEVKEDFMEMQKMLSLLQNLLYAESKNSLLIIIQGVDTSGKDAIIRKVFSVTNPMGVRVKAFKEPTPEEEKHDFLWRVYPYYPETGIMQIHNRSHYEDIIMPLLKKSLPEKIIKNRIHLINAVEKNLVLSNTHILKFFLYISKNEQEKRIAERMEDPEKRWKYESDDRIALKKYDKYIDIYERIFKDCAKAAPWHIIPSDNKWYRNYRVAEIVVNTLENMEMEYPGLEE
jgi:PPK2 family polyphosphate:nucleotide phosphotransferase